MPIKVINTELGHSLPPEEPHNITFHIPGWDTAKALRRGDQTLLSKLVSIYPRFGAWCEVRQLSTLLHATLALPATHGLLLFSHPDVFATAQRYSASPFRRSKDGATDNRIPPEDLWFRVVDIPSTTETETIRLYTIAFPLAKAPGAVGVWQNFGFGISSRLAAALLPAAERGEVKVLEWKGDGTTADLSLNKVPEGKGLPLGEAHLGLRKRIAELVGGGGKVGEGDVWLYPTGMGAIWRLHRALVEVRGGGTVVVLGSVFHNSWHLFQEGVGGMKHFGNCDGGEGMMDEVEAFLEGERQAGRKVGYVFAEFPSNPILVSVDLVRLRKLADKYDVPVVIDDTIGSFCNIDVSPVADVIITSTTKSLSGYANVMGGSIVLPPTSPHHDPLKSTLDTHFLNEYYHPDAAKLLSNSADYFERSAILNRNALTLANFLHTHSLSPTSPITAVLYPPYTPTHKNYLSLLRPATPTFTPGYGCLFSIEFTSLAVARAFYDHLSVYHGPHLGAHHTLAFPFNDAIWGPDPEAAAYLITFGARPEQVRVSVGLEGEEELVDTFKEALRYAEEVERGEKVVAV